MPLRKNDLIITEQADFLGAMFDAGTVEIYTGTQPVDPNSAPSGSLLATITIPNPAFDAAVDGVAEKDGTWTTTATGTGAAGYARFKSSDTLRTMDMPVSNIPGSGMLLINTLDIVSGNAVTVVSLTITSPATE